MTTSDESPEPASTTRERLPIPDGTIPVGIALLIAGIATYAFFKIGNVAVGGDKAFAPITALWFATFALAPGFFLPLEQVIVEVVCEVTAGQTLMPCALFLVPRR